MVVGVIIILAAGTTTVIVINHGRNSAAKSQSPPVTGDSFQQESEVRMTRAKQWALACIMCADDNQNQLPKDFDQLKAYAGSLSSSNWEIVSGGSLNSFTNPSRTALTILLREKESRQSPGGGFVKAYAFVDGHAELISSPNDDFLALEKQRGFFIHPANN